MRRRDSGTAPRGEPEGGYAPSPVDAVPARASRKRAPGRPRDSGRAALLTALRGASLDWDRALSPTSQEARTGDDGGPHESTRP
jgi:hypothetical protein